MKETIARELIDKRGILAEIYCTKTVEKEGEPGRERGIKILYLGPDTDEDRDIHAENDPYVYTRLMSPFPEEPGYYNAAGIIRDGNRELWTAEKYAMAFLKSPELYDRGLHLKAFVPEELAELSPNLYLKCNGRVISKVSLDRAGTVDLRAGIKNADDGITDYLYDTRRLLMILLHELKRVCEKYGLRYYLICGGLIGMMRDNALIPWDDDMDIAMTREDYDKLNAAAEKEWPEGSEFLWLTPEKTGDDAFLDFMTRLVYLKEEAPSDAFERLGDRGRKDIHFRMPLDIYILEHAPADAAEHEKLVRKLQRLYVLLMGRRGYFDDSAHKEMGRAKLAAAKLAMRAGRLIPRNYLLKKYRKYASKYKDVRTGFYYQSNGYYASMGLRFEEEIFGGGREMMAGAETVRVPDDGCRFLEIMYGNYREYPIVYERRPRHAGHIKDGYLGTNQ